MTIRVPTNKLSRLIERLYQRTFFFGNFYFKNFDTCLDQCSDCMVILNNFYYLWLSNVDVLRSNVYTWNPLILHKATSLNTQLDLCVAFLNSVSKLFFFDEQNFSIDEISYSAKFVLSLNAIQWKSIHWIVFISSIKYHQFIHFSYLELSPSWPSSSFKVY